MKHKTKTGFTIVDRQFVIISTAMSEGLRTEPECASQTRSSTRNLSGDEIANVNFLYDDIVHRLQNRLVHKFGHAQIDAVGTQVQLRFTKFNEITQCNGHYAVQVHSRSPILVPIESSYVTSY